MEAQNETLLPAIELIQLPVIKHRLKEVGLSVTKRLDDLNIDNLIANEDTLKYIKQLITELNKEFAEYDNQRKLVKKGASNPIDVFEEDFKAEITNKYTPALNILKSKRDSVEVLVKDETKKTIEAYFDELCVSKEIDFVKFSQAGIEINLSTSIKQYKERCSEFVEKIASDLILINSTEYPVEATAEYKRTLNASKSILDVKARKDAEQLERERIKREETNKRQTALRGLTMVYHDITKTFNYVSDESIMIDYSDVVNLSNDDFRAKFVEAEAKIKAFQNAQPKTQPETIEVKKAPAEPLKAPVVAEAPKVEQPLRSAKFEVTGTYDQLKGLGQYMKDNGIIYTNLE